MKNNKGITLIALVITIIVLLILAGITIAMLTGDNGLLTKSNEAKITDMEAAATEKVKLAVAAANLEMQSQLVTKSTFDPRTVAADATTIKNVIANDLSDTNDWTVNDPVASGETRTITVQYKNADYVNSVQGNQPKTYTINLKVPSTSDSKGITVSY